ncbi:MAG: hypothetical protein K2Q18_12680, partial [Bdellovibrionales bacterium]|nr:hypothetical protein [Bdellovibrionales bacterium]
MKKKDILELINSEIASRNTITGLDESVINVTTNLQNAENGDVVFYKVSQTEKSIEDFNKRLKDRRPGLIVLNHGAEAFIKTENCIFIDVLKFLNIQKRILDQIYPNKQKLKI